MPTSDDEGVLKTIPQLPMSEVPRAGHRELVEYKRERESTKASFGFWAILFAAAFGVTAALLSEGIGAYVLFLGLSAVCATKAGSKFFRLAAGPKSWQALPEGANETTAQLEDGTAKSIRQWNSDVYQWNLELACLNNDVEVWRKRGEDPSMRPEDWCEESHAVDRDTLMAQGIDLTLKRKALIARRKQIRRVIKVVGDTIRKAQEETRNGDPERK